MASRALALDDGPGRRSARHRKRKLKPRGAVTPTVGNLLHDGRVFVTFPGRLRARSKPVMHTASEKVPTA